MRCFCWPRARAASTRGVDVTVDVGNGAAGTVQRLASGAYEMGFVDLSTLIEFMGNNPHLPRAQASRRNCRFTTASASNLAFGLKSKPSSDLIFNSTFLPRVAERRDR